MKCTIEFKPGRLFLGFDVQRRCTWCDGWQEYLAYDLFVVLVPTIAIHITFGRLRVVRGRRLIHLSCKELRHGQEEKGRQARREERWPRLADGG